MIDVGVNLASSDFDADRPDVLRRAFAAGVTTLIATGTDVESSRASEALAGCDAAGAPRVYATAGVHPHHAGEAGEAGDAGDDWPQAIAAIAESPHVVAIGETGLDFYRDFSPRDAQRDVFRRQIELAVETGKPLFVHDRDSAGETRRILSDYRDGLADCVIHCFTGNAAELDAYLEDGYHIGITGWICDERRGRKLVELAPRIPADRLLVETDAPYLLPRTIKPKPRSRRNEPAFLRWVVRQLAQCRREDPDLVAQRTHDNARRFFRLGEASSGTE